jgi:uncharacterized protein with GYD domain
MTTFIVLCRFGDEGASQLLRIGDGKTPDLRAAADAALGKLGGKLIGVWFCIGEYDLVAVVEAPDPQRALGFILAFSSVGNARTVTLTAEGEIGDVLRYAGEAVNEVKIQVGGDPTATIVE